MEKKMNLIIGLCLVGLLGCAEKTPEVDTAAVVEAINEVREREWAALSSGDIDGLLAVFANDAVMMPPEAPMVSGEMDIREWAQGMADQFTIGGGYTGSEVEVIGDWAVERYTGNLELTVPSGESVAMPVKGIHVYQRQPDGSWLIVQDIWNINQPAGGNQ